jgi:hypothetical protein
MSDKELTFISKSKDSKLARACVVFATAFNRLDASIIGSHLAEEVSFCSLVMLDELNGKAEVLDYITAKFEAIRKSGLPSRIRAELALDPLDIRPCVLVYRRHNKYEAGFGEPIAYVVLETDSSGLIPSIFFVAIDPESCQRTGIFPGLSAEQIVRDVEGVEQRL